LILHKWTWRRKIVDEWGKEAPRGQKVDIIPDTPAYRRWLKNNPIDPRINDMNFGVVYNGITE